MLRCLVVWFPMELQRGPRDQRRRHFQHVGRLRGPLLLLAIVVEMFPIGTLEREPWNSGSSIRNGLSPIEMLSPSMPTCEESLSIQRGEDG